MSRCGSLFPQSFPQLLLLEVDPSECETVQNRIYDDDDCERNGGEQEIGYDTFHSVKIATKRESYNMIMTFDSRPFTLKYG